MKTAHFPAWCYLTCIQLFCKLTAGRSQQLVLRAVKSSVHTAVLWSQVQTVAATSELHISGSSYFLFRSDFWMCRVETWKKKGTKWDKYPSIVQRHGLDDIGPGGSLLIKQKRLTTCSTTGITLHCSDICEADVLENLHLQAVESGWSHKSYLKHCSNLLWTCTEWHFPLLRPNISKKKKVLLQGAH